MNKNRKKKSPRLGESPKEIVDSVKSSELKSLTRFDTLGDGYYFLDSENKWQRMIDKFLMRPATSEELSLIQEALESDMIQVEEKVMGRWVVVHQAKGNYFKRG